MISGLGKRLPFVGIMKFHEYSHIMELLKEMKDQGLEVLDHHPKVHCKVFEDNSGALEMASVHKWRPA